MIRIACQGRHGSADVLCDACGDLLVYAMGRLDKCSYQETKPTCAGCPIHCYHPAMRDRIRAVMRYAGPRMVYRRPLLALGHLVDGLRRSPRDRLHQERRAQDAPD